MQLTLARAQTYGRVSDRNSKMPASTFALHTKACPIGAKLAKVEGSVCHKCYAVKFEGMYPSVDKGHWYNTTTAAEHIVSDPEAWSQAMALQITRICDRMGIPYHRWFDSGDLQNLAMLRAIARVCELTPTIKHWLPTREAAIFKAFLRERDLPANLVVRVSSTMIDDQPIAGHQWTSTVHKNKPHTGDDCRARDRNNECGPCRKCWDRSVPNVSYPFHA